MFLALGRMCADELIGPDGPYKAWVEIQRMLSHSVARKACLEAESVDFPPEILKFARLFVELQATRHLADYNPVFELSESEVSSQIDDVKECISGLEKVDGYDLVAFAVWVLASGKGIQESRARFRKGLDGRDGK